MVVEQGEIQDNESTVVTNFSKMWRQRRKGVRETPDVILMNGCSEKKIY